MEVSGQIYAPTLEKLPPVPFALQGFEWAPDWVWSFLRIASAGNGILVPWLLRP